MYNFTQVQKEHIISELLELMEVTSKYSLDSQETKNKVAVFFGIISNYVGRELSQTEVDSIAVWYRPTAQELVCTDTIEERKSVIDRYINVLEVNING